MSLTTRAVPQTLGSEEPQTLASEAQPEASAGAAGEWHLRLYVAGQTAKSRSALINLRRLCETHLAGRYTIEIVDLLVTPRLAAGDQILAVPTLVRKLPAPLKKIIGDLSSEERFLVDLGIRRPRRGDHDE